MLYLRSNDSISKYFDTTLNNYLKWNKYKVLFLEVNLSKMPYGVELLKVAIVPQLRVYRYGVEVHRHRGTADYGQLNYLIALI